MKDPRIPLPKNPTLPLDAISKRFFIVTQAPAGGQRAPAGGQQLLLAEHTRLGWCRVFIDRYKQVLGGAQLIGGQFELLKKAYLVLVEWIRGPTCESRQSNLTEAELAS